MTEPCRVLLVDEDPNVVDVAREFLERADPGLDVETVTSASTAVDRVEQGAVDVLVTDYKMPEMDGVDLASRVDVPCLLYTAAEPEMVEDAIEDPVEGLVRKRTGNDQYDELAASIRDVAGDDSG